MGGRGYGLKVGRSRAPLFSTQVPLRGLKRELGEGDGLGGDKQKMFEAIALEGMFRLFFQGRAGAFHQLDICAQSFSWLQPSWMCSLSVSDHLVFHCGKAADRDKAISLEHGEFHPSSPWLTPHFLEAGTIVENKDSAEEAQPGNLGAPRRRWMVNSVLFCRAHTHAEVHVATEPEL